jgi:CheY-like chemotaxis protein
MRRLKMMSRRPLAPVPLCSGRARPGSRRAAVGPNPAMSKARRRVPSASSGGPCDVGSTSRKIASTPQIDGEASSSPLLLIHPLAYFPAWPASGAPGILAPVARRRRSPTGWSHAPGARRFARAHGLLAGGTEAPLMSEAAPLVLVVDDDAALRELLQLALGELGYAIAFAADGAEALELARLQRPSLVLLDWRMPKLDGEATAAALRAMYGAALPIVVMSVASQPTASSARQLGATFLPKPFALDELLRVVAAAVARGAAGGTPPLD